MRYVDGLFNPKIYRRPEPKRAADLWRQRLKKLILPIIVFTIAFAGLTPQVKSLARQAAVFELVTNGRYLVLFQNDAEIRASGGFIGSFAVVEANNKTIKPLYFETNIYKLDDPYSERTKIEPPKPLRAAIGQRGWALRDANFAADFRQSAPTILWFFNEEAKSASGQRRLELERSLGGKYQLDGVIATTMSAFLDILEATGPITLERHNLTVSRETFFSLVQQIVERDYFSDPANRQENEPKTILQDLFPVAMTKAQQLPKSVQYKLAKQLLQQKKVLIYTSTGDKEQILTEQGWAGALTPPESLTGRRPSDYLAVIRSSHAGNKSSLDINPVYRYVVTSDSGEMAKVKLEITFEHTGTGLWPSGVSHEYLRVLTPAGAKLVDVSQAGESIITKVDEGEESGFTAFGFWLHTEPKSSQSVTLEYELPRSAIAPSTVFGRDNYQLTAYRQPGGNSPDLTIIYNDRVLYEGRLNHDRVFRAR